MWYGTNRDKVLENPAVALEKVLGKRYFQVSGKASDRLSGKVCRTVGKERELCCPLGCDDNIYQYKVPLREEARGVAQERNEKHPA